MRNDFFPFKRLIFNYVEDVGVKLLVLKLRKRKRYLLVGCYVLTSYLSNDSSIFEQFCGS